MAINWIEGVLRHSKCTGSDLLLLILLAESADRDSGACYPGVQTLAKLMRTSVRNVQYRIKELREMGELSVQYQRSPFGTNLYVLNRSLLGDEPHFTPLNHTSPPGEVQFTPPVKPTSPKPSVEPIDKERKTPTSFSKRQTRLDPDWVPSQYQITYATDQGMSETQIRKTADNFRDYWLSTGKTKLDWDATWRGWVRRELENPRASPNGTHRNGKVDMFEVARRLREQERAQT